MAGDRISRFGQMKVYFGKCVRLFRSEKQWKNLVSTLIIMLIICMVTSTNMFLEYAPTRNGAFAIVCACIWIGLFNSIQSICRERDIIKREHRTGLHISSYVLAHAAYELCLCFAESIIVLAMMLVQNHAHLPPSGLVFPMAIDLWMTLFLAIYSSDLIAILISCSVKSENTAMTVMPFVLIIQLVMSGTVFELSGISQLVSNFTISKWCLNGICSVANTDLKVSLQYDYSGHVGCDATAGNLMTIWAVLLAFSIVYLSISILMLKQVDRDQR